MKHYVSAVYDIPGQFGYDSAKETLIREAAGPSSGSGSGFGQRDHSWYDLTKRAALEKARALRKIPGLKVSVQEQKF